MPSIRVTAKCRHRRDGRRRDAAVVRLSLFSIQSFTFGAAAAVPRRSPLGISQTYRPRGSLRESERERERARAAQKIPRETVRFGVDQVPAETKTKTLSRPF